MKAMRARERSKGHWVKPQIARRVEALRVARMSVSKIVRRRGQSFYAERVGSPQGVALPKSLIKAQRRMRRAQSYHRRAGELPLIEPPRKRPAQISSASSRSPTISWSQMCIKGPPAVDWVLARRATRSIAGCAFPRSSADLHSS